MRLRLYWSLLLPAIASGYPLDGAERTGIRRLAGYRLAHEGKIRGSIKLPPGGLWTTDRIALRLAGSEFDITASTPRDPYLQAGIDKIFAGRDPSYHLALVDISEPGSPRYAALRADEKMIPGSVGKLLLATGVFGALKRIHPNNPGAREKLLRETIVAADSFVYRDGKTVPFYNPEAGTLLNRRLEAGDRFNLWEWLDHMLSQSSNAAASMVWKQAMLLHRYGGEYPGKQNLEGMSKGELSELALESIESALKASGLDTSRLRIGTFFTSNASRAIPGRASYASPNELLRWLIKMEQGKLVDAWSSLEMKRLLYFSRPRYRYASSPALGKAAVFFKSGSLFQCEPEPGYQCVQYKGNKTNLMHSVAVVESGSKVYLVAMMSNVLRLNSAVEHQTIATEIERLVGGRPGK